MFRELWSAITKPSDVFVLLKEFQELFFGAGPVPHSLHNASETFILLSSLRVATSLDPW